jgi:hypothetical protein
VPIDVARFTTEVTVADGDMPLTPAQIEKLVALVARRVEERQRDRDRSREANAIRPQAAVPPRGG